MINKIVMTKSAVFDYEEIVCLIPMNAYQIKTRAEKLLDKGEFFTVGEDIRMPYYDKVSDTKLIFFLKKGYRFGIMQMYVLQGICKESDYDGQMEENGSIKEWLDVEIL